MARNDYEIVQSGKRWELRAGGIARAHFASKQEALEAAEGLGKSAASIARVHGDESERIAKRGHVRGPRSAQGSARRRPGGSPSH
jgi:uncharacterized protein DUF2188